MGGAVVERLLVDLLPILIVTLMFVLVSLLGGMISRVRRPSWSLQVLIRLWVVAEFKIQSRAMMI